MWSLKHNRSEILPQTAGAVSQWNRQGVALLTGSSGIFPLSHRWQFGLVQRGFYIHTIDCAIRFDAYAIAEEALRHGISPEDIHDRITVSRCFTPYQILDEMRSVLETGYNKGETGKIYFILAPSKQFFDGDVAKDEGAFLLGKLSAIFGEIRKKSVPLMVVEKESYSHPAFLAFIKHTKEIAQPLFQLTAAAAPGSRHAREIKKIYSVRIAGPMGEIA
jgi:hypothetical protein